MPPKRANRKRISRNKIPTKGVLPAVRTRTSRKASKAIMSRELETAKRTLIARSLAKGGVPPGWLERISPVLNAAVNRAFDAAKLGLKIAASTRYRGKVAGMGGAAAAAAMGLVPGIGQSGVANAVAAAIVRQITEDALKDLKAYLN